MAGSKWRGQVEAMRRLLPRGAGRRIEGIFMRIVDPAAPGMIAGLAYDCCTGCSHPLDGQSIEFDPPIEGAQLPEPWFTLLLQSQQEGMMPSQTRIVAEALSLMNVQPQLNSASGAHRLTEA